MEPAEGLALDKVRCAEAHAAQEADPAGTAPVWDAVLAVEIPGPWPKDISLVEPFATPAGSKVATITGADGRAWRPQGLLCDKDCDWRTVIAFERPHPGSGPFLRREWLMPASDPPATAALVGALLAGDQDAVAVHDDRRQDPPEGTVDLLLCTH